MSRPSLKWLAGLALAGAVGLVGWWKFFRAEPQPAFASEAEWFKYGSFEGEAKTGLPYWIWLELPRIFPDLLPGPGGYAAFGIVWEPGQEMPVGMAKRTVGFPRVTQNCALCHTATYRLSADQPAPTIVLGGPAHTLDIQGLIRFLARAAADPRFNADTFLAAIAQETKLSLLDRLSYRFLIIPLTRQALLKQGREFAWTDRPGGPGRDDSFNLPKFMVAHLPDDGTAAQADFAAVWRLDRGQGSGQWFNWGGETPAVRTVLVDSSSGFGPKPGSAYEANLARLGAFLSRLQPPAWPYCSGPYAVDPARAAAGRQIYQHECAECHEPAGRRYRTNVPLAEIGTDPARANTWTAEAADAVNRAIAAQGYDRPPLAKHDGYLAGPLDGLWLRGPYLHNGSVPNLRELLEPPEERSAVFYRGCDVVDPVNVGFVTRGPAAERTGFRLDTRERGNGNGGHRYGVALPPRQKAELLEYLKTL